MILAAVVPHLLPELVHGLCGVEELNGEEVDLGGREEEKHEVVGETNGVMEWRLPWPWKPGGPSGGV